MFEDDDYSQQQNDQDSQESTDAIQYLKQFNLTDNIIDALISNDFDPKKHVLRKQNEHKHIVKYEGIDNILVEAYKAGASLPTLSEIFGWTQQTIGHRIEKYYPLRPKGRALGYSQPDFNPAEVREITEEDIAKMVKLYKEEGKTLGEIAAEYKISPSKVSYLLTPFGIIEKPWVKRKPRGPNRNKNG